MASILLHSLEPVFTCPCCPHMLRVLRVEHVQCVEDVQHMLPVFRSPQNSSQHALKRARHERE